mmetsp:Transcript_36186/g.53995  ORF Transcript_36186/g.53995 Transcript_36186/m.53995 type:complete len:179 (-) Transcript_36186:225-761(-)
MAEIEADQSISSSATTIRVSNASQKRGTSASAVVPPVSLVLGRRSANSSLGEGSAAEQQSRKLHEQLRQIRSLAIRGLLCLLGLFCFLVAVSGGDPPSQSFGFLVVVVVALAEILIQVRLIRFQFVNWIGRERWDDIAFAVVGITVSLFVVLHVFKGLHIMSKLFEVATSSVDTSKEL